MTYNFVELTRQDALVTLSFNRPQALNALSMPMLDEIGAALDEVSRGNARALLLRGNGRGFCSGLDLHNEVVAPGTSDLGLILETRLNKVLLRLLDLPIPVVVAVRGAAAGGGCSLALAGDFILAGETAFFLQAFMNIGLVPDTGATWMLPRLVGKARAMQMMLLGERLPARRALEWGLIYDVTGDDRLDAAAEALALRLASGPTVAYGLARRAIIAAMHTDLDAALARERADQRTAGFSADFVEGVEAFAERRAPRFTGQ